MLELLALNSTMHIHQLLSVKRRKSVRIRMDSVVLVLGLALQESAALQGYDARRTIYLSDIVLIFL
jgi:hypothetical protein